MMSDSKTKKDCLIGCPVMTCITSASTSLENVWLALGRIPKVGKTFRACFFFVNCKRTVSNK